MLREGKERKKKDRGGGVRKIENTYTDTHTNQYELSSKKIIKLPVSKNQPKKQKMQIKTI